MKTKELLAKIKEDKGKTMIVALKDLWKESKLFAVLFIASLMIGIFDYWTGDAVNGVMFMVLSVIIFHILVNMNCINKIADKLHEVIEASNSNYDNIHNLLKELEQRGIIIINKEVEDIDRED